MTKSLARFAEWLLNALWNLGIVICNAGVDVVNATIATVAGTFGLLLSVLPDSTLDLTPPVGLILLSASLNWFIPMHAIAGGVTLICATYVAYFSIRPVAKFIQVA